jgi:threonine synthase
MSHSSIACSQCATAYPDQGTPHLCPHCGGIYDWVRDFPLLPSITGQSPDATIWHWQEAFCLKGEIIPVSLGEGQTPLVSDRINGLEIFYKLESLNPTGSYKDRASSVLISFLRSRGVTSAVEDSSGNAGVSFSAYAARAGIHAKVYVPESTSGPKRRQIEAYGAELIQVSGPRSAAAEAVKCEADAGAVYASHAYMPFGLAGIATISYELFEQLGQVPGTVVAPAGHGSLVLGILRGFRSLRGAGLTKRMPVLIAIQSTACDPIRAAWNSETISASEQATLAEGVRVIHPVRMTALLNELDPKCDLVLAYDDKCIIVARHELGQRGIDVEPTAALAYCALKNCKRKLPEPIVLVLTGSGLKYGGTS